MSRLDFLIDLLATRSRARWPPGRARRRCRGFDCELLELVPNERIVFRWRFVGPERVADPAHDSRLAITFRDAPGGATELTLVHECLDALHDAMPHVAENVGRGWEMALDKLGAAIAE